jgi:hypothetical protein
VVLPGVRRAQGRFRDGGILKRRGFWSPAGYVSKRVEKAWLSGCFVWIIGIIPK